MADFTCGLQPADPQGPSLLAQERARSSIDVEQLAKHLLSRNDFLNRQKRILSILTRIPLFSKKNLLNIARPDRYQLGLARAKTLRRLSLKHGWDQEDYLMAEYLMDEMGPYALQSSMFATSIREQCSDEQKAYWLPKVENWEIIGCYGQTELGHGSNVKGIECQAKWDPQTKEFIIHSPTITASKWWNGALGRTANHAIVVAQLLLPGPENNKYESYGPHQFIVQIRNLKSNKPLDGIVIGDIGPKYGYPGMDNGYMLFNHFRVPHAALLSKYSGVDPEHGAYIRPNNPALVYGTMTFIRAQIIMHARLVLARAVTIAVRYLSIRRQFSDRDSKDPCPPEQAVLNYPTVQIRIIPLLATTFALHYTGESMSKLYWSTRQQIESTGDISRLAEMHAASSCLKSVCTTLAADGIETCRRAMGGHGFGGGSGMVGLNNEYLSKPTVEGDNWMITQQTASYLIKTMAAVLSQPNFKTKDSIQEQFQEYILGTEDSRKNPNGLDVVGDPFALVAAFKQRVSYFAHQMFQARVIEKESWTNLMIPLHRLSCAHAESLLVSNFYEAVFTRTSHLSIDKATVDILQTLFRLFALFTLRASASEFLVSKAITVEMVPRVTPAIQELMAHVRPHAVRLVDAWSIPDYLLDSDLGSYDGDVYNRVFQRAHQENPLNMLTFNSDWKSEEIIMGEGAEAASKRIQALALGVAGRARSPSLNSKL
ncbi:Acyl-coenzyme A oxidase [Cercospora zeina]